MADSNAKVSPECTEWNGINAQHDGMSDKQHYALKWNDFHSTLLKSLQHLRDEEDFVDVTLACDRRSFRAHKIVLSACSPYFCTLLKSNPCEHPIIIVRDICADDVENLLRFMYNGEVNVSQNNLQNFLKTAKALQVRGLTDTGGFSGDFVKPTADPVKGTAIENIQKNSDNNSNIKSNFNSDAICKAAVAQLGVATNVVLSSKILKNVEAKTDSQPSIEKDLPPLYKDNSTHITGAKAASASPIRKNSKQSNLWEQANSDNKRKTRITPPPQKRIKSADLFCAQHGISPDRLRIDPEFSVAGQHPLTRNRSRGPSKDRERQMDFKDSLLGQALENSNTPLVTQNKDELDSLHNQSTCEDTISSDVEPSECLNEEISETIEGQRSQSFPNAFIGLQSMQGLMSGTSTIANDFASRSALEMRVRATDPRPCPKCNKIYRSAHTLRTHLEDKHTVCPGYRCVLCGTVAKSRNSLHSHMSRQHRGISTKDLPVLAMPSPFDPELASRLLAKAGVKVTPAELRARASPTGVGATGQQQVRLDLGDGICESLNEMFDGEDTDDNPEDLRTGNGYNANKDSSENNSPDISQYHEKLLNTFGCTNMSPFRDLNIMAEVSKVVNLGQKEPNTSTLPTNRLIFDAYMRLVSEGHFGMGISPEQATSAALHAAKLAHLNVLGHNLEQLPQSLLPNHLNTLTGNPVNTFRINTNMSSDLSEHQHGFSGNLSDVGKKRAESDGKCDPNDSVDFDIRIEALSNNDMSHEYSVEKNFSASHQSAGSSPKSNN